MKLRYLLALVLSGCAPDLVIELEATGPDGRDVVATISQRLGGKFFNNVIECGADIADDEILVFTPFFPGCDAPFDPVAAYDTCNGTVMSAASTIDRLLEDAPLGATLHARVGNPETDTLDGLLGDLRSCAEFGEPPPEAE